ncbi:response regulator transcription factor [Massilia pseudoviolaceinigra]|uniref:response regulator transcription factor n=1 Tax=Massilia pseudoviolaceinigra TaxID=3057165 RepID=UPI002796512F|nr:response regulator transcription factor [Massilia sp. CCM 9206]MDQ1919943.1 response regulator transcription factor [Massilia sp. CCM 9206]
MKNEAQDVSGPIKVMLVEDHQTMLWGLQTLVDAERPRMTVVGTARTCAEALAGAAQLAPDVILLDLDLGGVSTVEFLPELLANGVSRALVLTAAHDPDLLDLAVRRGARGILHKEVTAEQVIKAIAKIHRGELWFDADTMDRVFGQMLGWRRALRADPPEEKHAALTARERAIVSAAVEHSGCANHEVAQRLFISEHTLRNHLSSIYRKLDVPNRLGMYVYAIRHGLVQPQPGQSGPRHERLNGH